MRVHVCALSVLAREVNSITSLPFVFVRAWLSISLVNERGCSDGTLAKMVGTRCYL